MNTPRSTILAPAFAAVALGIVVALFAPPLGAQQDSGGDGDELGPRVTIRSPAPSLGHGLALRDGRALWRGPSSLVNRPPYLVAATGAEAKEGKGIELRWSNLHRLLEPVPSAGAARTLVRAMEGGEIVPDRAAYDRLVDAARRTGMPEGSWEVTIHPRVPERFGLEAERTADGFEVRGTIFTTSWYCALSVVEIRARFPEAGSWTLETWPAISGPPQSWQTSGEVDPTEERRLHEAVSAFRIALLDELRRDWTLETIRKAYTEGATMAIVRQLLGEPLDDIGSGQHLYVYRLGDGRAVVFTAAGDDDRLGDATLYSSYDGARGVGERLEVLQRTPIRAGRMAPRD